MARSTDGGRTFRRVVADPAVHRVTSPDEATPAYTEMIGAIAVDPGRPGRIAVGWPEAKGEDSSRIVVRVSVDGGEHWGPRIDVADDPAAKPDQHDHVTLAWLKDGPLFVGWRDRRCCGGAWADRYQQWVRAVRVGRFGTATPGRVVEYSDGPQAGNTLSGRGVLQPDEFQGLVATRVRPQECATSVVMGHPRVLEVFEAAFVECWRVRVGDVGHILGDTRRLALASVSVDYLAPVVVDAVLEIRVYVDRVTERSLLLFYEALVAGRPVGRARSHYVCVDPESGRPSSWRSDVISALREDSLSARKPRAQMAHVS